jgi:hypothetical protein
MVDAEPGSEAVATPLVETATEAGAEELQVNGTATCDPGDITMFPAVSVTVGVIVSDVLVASVICSAIDSTAQVVKFTGTLFAVPIAAYTGVMPGTWAVACTWFKDSPLTMLCSPKTPLLKSATPRFTCCQLNWPTVEVISVPWLKARAS